MAIIPDDVFVDLTTDDPRGDDAPAAAARASAPSADDEPTAVAGALDYLRDCVGSSSADPGRVAMDVDLEWSARRLGLPCKAVVENDGGGVDDGFMLPLPALQAMVGDDRPDAASPSRCASLAMDPWECQCLESSAKPITVEELTKLGEGLSAPSEADADADVEEGSADETESERAESEASEAESEEESEAWTEDEADEAEGAEEDSETDDSETESGSSSDTESDTESEVGSSVAGRPTDAGARLYGAVQSVFEPVEGEAITGHLKRASVERLFRALAGMSAPYAMDDKQRSVFLDLGSGMGYLLAYALLYCDRSLGVEFASTIHAQ